MDCSNCYGFYFGECKQSLKFCSDEHKRSVNDGDCQKMRL